MNITVKRVLEDDFEQFEEAVLPAFDSPDFAGLFEAAGPTKAPGVRTAVLRLVRQTLTALKEFDLFDYLVLSSPLAAAAAMVFLVGPALAGMIQSYVQVFQAAGM